MKHKKIKLFKIYFIISILVVITIFLLIGVVKYFLIYSETKENYESVVFKIKKEENEKKEIEELNKRYSLDTEIQRNILEKNMLQRPGEKVIELVD